MQTIRWGIMGAGAIVRRWIRGARLCEGMEIVAIASRTEESAKRAAEELGIPQAMSYEALAASDTIDAVYVAVPHTGHEALAMLAMRGGKAVLVEKPATVSVRSFERMVNCAKEHNVLLMEGVWTRFFPLYQKLPALFTEEGIGKPRMVQGAFSYRVGDLPRDHRLVDPNKGGGGLLDVGVYPLHFADIVFDHEPIETAGYAAIDTDELHLQVDEQAAFIARYDDGAMTMMASGIRTEMSDVGVIYGTRGKIEIPRFWKPTVMKVTIGGETKTVEEQVYNLPDTTPDEGFQYEINHFNDCLRRGLTESPVMTHERSRRILRQCDILRESWGLSDPLDR